MLGGGAGCARSRARASFPLWWVFIPRTGTLFVPFPPAALPVLRGLLLTSPTRFARPHAGFSAPSPRADSRPPAEQGAPEARCAAGALVTGGQASTAAACRASALNAPANDGLGGFAGNPLEETVACNPSEQSSSFSPFCPCPRDAAVVGFHLCQ